MSNVRNFFFTTIVFSLLKFVSFSEYDEIVANQRGDSFYIRYISLLIVIINIFSPISVKILLKFLKY